MNKNIKALLLTICVITVLVVLFAGIFKGMMWMSHHPTQATQGLVCFIIVVVGCLVFRVVKEEIETKEEK